jgi:16S rRNA (guanine966-N2)-methyltransferase
MRVIAGEFKGMRLAAVPGTGTRPTTDRVKEAWGSTLESLLPGGFFGTHVLDAYAGSGALGLEALSRGAASCTFIERSQRAFATLRANVAKAGCSPSRVQLLKADASRQGVCPPAFGGKSYSLVILDPPYDAPVAQARALLGDMAARGLLADDALVSYEQRKGDERCLDAFVLLAEKHYGDITLRYYRHQPGFCQAGAHLKQAAADEKD